MEYPQRKQRRIFSNQLFVFFVNFPARPVRRALRTPLRFHFFAFETAPDFLKIYHARLNVIFVRAIAKYV